MTTDTRWNTDRDDPDADRVRGRRALLKMAMLGGGAALAGLMQDTKCRRPSRRGSSTPGRRRSCHARHAGAADQGCARLQIGGGGVNDSIVVKVETDQAGLYG